MNVYKIEVMVIDFDQLGEDDTKVEIENARFPNDCLKLDIKSIETRQIEWSDDHPLNKLDICEAEYKRLFSELNECVDDNSPVIELCDNGHSFAKYSDHPKKDGKARCPYCMAIGLDAARKRIFDLEPEFYDEGKECYTLHWDKEDSHAKG